MCKYFTLLSFGVQICRRFKGNTPKRIKSNKNFIKLGVSVDGGNKKENK